MRNIRIFEHISLDGIIEPDAREATANLVNGNWSAPYRSPAGAQALVERLGKYDLLLGRTTYDLWATYWPKMTTGPFATAINGATKYVATHRPDSLTWGPAKDLGPD